MSRDRGETCRPTANVGSPDNGEAAEAQPLLHEASKALEVVMAVGERLAGS